MPELAEESHIVYTLLLLIVLRFLILWNDKKTLLTRTLTFFGKALTRILNHF